ncbi:hypothetical protein BSG1_02235 [Bacillus sp. SG-1]|nr:hypothetical protein BSG1_02235 [Bacillus sp. SG-1]
MPEMIFVSLFAAVLIIYKTFKTIKKRRWRNNKSI